MQDGACRRLVFFALSFIINMACLASFPLPEYWPTCPEPQPIAPKQPLEDAWVNQRINVVWNGELYTVAWVSLQDHLPYVQQRFSDGAPAGEPIPLSATPAYWNLFGGPVLIWDGDGYAAAWTAEFDGGPEVVFRKLDRKGRPISSQVTLSNAAAVNPGGLYTYSMCGPQIAWNGVMYAVTWWDDRNGGMPNWDIFATLVEADGTIAGGGTSMDLPVCVEQGDQERSAIGWDRISRAFIVVWSDDRGPLMASYSRRLLANGQFSTEQLFSETPSLDHSLEANPNGLAAAWMDGRNDNAEIYFTHLDVFGQPVLPETRVTFDAAFSGWPSLIWTGVEFGCFWVDTRSGDYQIWYQRISESGALLGNNIQLTFGPSVTYADAAFAQHGFLMTSNAVPAGTCLVQPIGCGADTTSPSCPTNLIAQSITDSSITVSWGPSGDFETDLAYYRVYRDNAVVALVSETWYRDMGLTSNRFYNYMVQPVNAAQLQNYACGNSVLVQTDTPLMLTAMKSSSGVTLSWMDASPTRYEILRGMSPQGLMPFGNTSAGSFEDLTALSDFNLYYYAVNEQGW